MRVQQTSSTSTPNNNSGPPRGLLRRKRLHTFEAVLKKRRRAKPGARALQEIRHWQNNTDLLIRLAPFARLVKEITEELAYRGSESLSSSLTEPLQYKWKASAIEALQTAAEAFMTLLFEDINKAAIHGKRITIRPEDMHLVRSVRASVNPSEEL